MSISPGCPMSQRPCSSMRPVCQGSPCTVSYLRVGDGSGHRGQVAQAGWHRWHGREASTARGPVRQGGQYGKEARKPGPTPGNQARHTETRPTHGNQARHTETRPETRKYGPKHGKTWKYGPKHGKYGRILPEYCQIPPNTAELTLIPAVFR